MAVKVDSIAGRSLQYQSLFFQLPTELRLVIYEHVFFDSSGSEKEASDTLVPLLTCRQFYDEALRIAFSSVSFHLNWYSIAEKYFDGAWYESEDSPRIEIESRVNGVVIEHRIEPPATRNPEEFNIMSIAARAGLSDAHLGAIRRLTITSFMDLSLWWNGVPILRAILGHVKSRFPRTPGFS